MKHTKRLGALTLALVMTLTALSGCGGDPAGGSGSGSGDASSSQDLPQAEPMDLSGVTDPYLATAGIAGDTPVARVGGVDITAGELLYWLNYQAEYFMYTSYLTDIPWDSDLGDGVTLGSQIAGDALEAAAYYRILRIVGDKEGFTPAADIASSIDQEFEELSEELGSDEAVTHVLWAQVLTRDLLVYFNECSDLHLQLQELYCGENSGHYPTDADVQAWLDQEGIYRAKHILLKTVDTTQTITKEDGTQGYAPLDEETVAAQRALAGDLLTQLQGAEDPVALFDTLMNEYSEDEGLAYNPEGYTTYKGKMVAPFEETALSLQNGEISGIVESDYGYHIILRLPLDPADYRGELISQRMQELSDGWMQEYPTEKLPAFDQIDPAAFWEKLLSLQTAVQAEIQSADEANSGDASSASSSGDQS